MHTNTYINNAVNYLTMFNAGVNSPPAKLAPSTFCSLNLLLPKCNCWSNLSDGGTASTHTSKRLQTESSSALLPVPFRQAADHPVNLYSNTHTQSLHLVTLTHSVNSQCSGFWDTSKVSLNLQLDRCISAHGTSLLPLQESIIPPVTH